jgi:hypothetical protein
VESYRFRKRSSKRVGSLFEVKSTAAIRYVMSGLEPRKCINLAA